MLLHVMFPHHWHFRWLWRLLGSLLHTTGTDLNPLHACPIDGDKCLESHSNTPTSVYDDALTLPSMLELTVVMGYS